MPISLDTIRYGITSAPPRIIIYGVQGIGKTTFMSQAPYPILIQIEDGEGVIDIPRMPRAETFDDVMEQLAFLATEDHPFKTVGIDSLDWLEPLIWSKVINDNPIANKSGKTVKDIESYDYQRGYKMALDYWVDYIDIINYLRNTRGMMVIQIAHSAVQTFDSPESGSYDRYGIKLHVNKRGEGASALLQQHADCVFFANYKMHVTEEKGKFGTVKKRAMGTGNRMIFTEERPTHLAKNRYSLPYSIPFDKEGAYWNVLAAHIPFLQTFGLEAADAETLQAVAESQNDPVEPQTQESTTNQQ